MSEAHTIPDHVATRVARLINEAEDMRQHAADDLKQIYADLREELRGMGWVGSAVSAEVAALKGAISELRLDDEKKAKREEKGERVDDYVSMLSRARAHKREASGSYAEAKDGEKVTGGYLLATTPKASDPKASSRETAAQVTTPSPASSQATQAIADDAQAPASSATISEAPKSRPEAAVNPVADINTPATEKSGLTEPASEGQGRSLPANTKSVPIPEAEVPAFLRKDAPHWGPADFRPNCLNPEACAASGLSHCYACRKATETAEIQAA